ncbi:MAG TPA: glycosyltransferase family 2 protein [Bacteroidota bacterium]|nr:glycosyltransferase family 2 protein [Bacteroidota bacterium]
MAILSVVLVNYNGFRDTLDCIASLHASSLRDIDLIVVDNASTDGSVAQLRATHPDLHLICNTENLGFSAGNNVGIRRALETDSGYVLLLNNDTIVDTRALEVMIQTMEENPEAGIVGAKILYFDQPGTVWFAGGQFNRNSGFGKHFGLGKPDDGSFDAVRPCDFITGCCLLARREVFDQIGLLDEDFFAYLEDVDFCMRARDKGFTILYQPRARIHHKVSSTTAWDSPLYLYFNLRNKIVFLRKRSRPARWMPYIPLLVYYYLRQFARLIIKRRNAHAVRAAWWGLIDGLRNFTGTQGRGRVAQVETEQ